MHPINAIFAALGALVLGLGLVSKRLEQTPIPLTLIALLFGVALGPVGLGVIDLAAFGERAPLLEKMARLVLAVALVSVALRIPKAYPWRNLRTMSVLLGLGMPLMWAASTLVTHLALGLDVWRSALVGAIVTATDPIAAAPIVTGPVAEKNLPDRIRHAISLESGANDGLGYLFVFLPLLMLTRPSGEALTHWATHTLLWEVGVAALTGLVLGVVAGKLLQAAETSDSITDEWRLVYTVALSLLAVGLGRLVGSDEVLVVFAAGAAFVQIVGEGDREEEVYGQEAVNRFFSFPVFALFGAALPWSGWAGLGWSGVALAVGIVLFRRLPALLLLRPLIPDFRRWTDALFMGWFGPIAVSAIYYAALVEERLAETVVWEAVSLVIVASVVVHGVTAVPFTRWYGRRMGTDD